MNTVTKTKNWGFISNSEVVSKPGAAITVTELTLTTEGKHAVTTDLDGIFEGASKVNSVQGSRKVRAHTIW